MNRGEEEQEQERTRTGKGSGRDGTKKLDENHIGSREIQSGEGELKRKRRRENSGQRRTGNDLGTQLRKGSWDVCGFATDECKRMEITRQVRKHDLDVVGIQEPSDEEGAKVGCKVGGYVWMGKK